jgi:hypothetical protein
LLVHEIAIGAVQTAFVNRAVAVVVKGVAANLGLGRMDGDVLIIAISCAAMAVSVDIDTRLACVTAVDRWSGISNGCIPSAAVDR